MMAVDRNDDSRVMAELVIAVMILVIQGDWEHWPQHQQRDGPHHGIWILVSEIKGLSRLYNIRLIGQRTGKDCHEMAG